MCRDGIPPNNCAAVIILALSSSGQVFSNQCPRLFKKCYFTIPFEGLDHYPRVSKQKKVEFDRLVLSPPPSPSIGVGLENGSNFLFPTKRSSAISSWDGSVSQRMNALGSVHRLVLYGFALRKSTKATGHRRPGKHVFFMCSKGAEIRDVVCRNA